MYDAKVYYITFFALSSYPEDNIFYIRVVGKVD